MNFIYDILVNFNNDLYDFYDWNTNDSITHIRKIPLFRVSTIDLEKIKKFNLKFDIEFLKKIENKTEKFTSRDVEKIEYVAMFSDCNEVIVVKFNGSGLSCQLSKLLVDEQEEVIDVCNRCNESSINYEVLNKRDIDLFKTRNQIEKRKYLLKSLKRLEVNKDFDKLKYLYFECFDIQEESLKKVISNLKAAIENDKLENIMYDFFKLISIN